MKHQSSIGHDGRAVALSDPHSKFLGDPGFRSIFTVFILVAASSMSLGCEDFDENMKEEMGASEELTDVTTSSHPITTKYFGMHCGSSWENTWKATLTNATTICSRFSSALDDEATRKFYYNMVNKQYYWETGGDQATNSLEDVHLFFTLTHGQDAPHNGVNGTPADPNNRATWSMWNDTTSARSDHMALGNEGIGLSIFSQYSCATLKWDSVTFDRWDNIFKGGLRAATGFMDGTSWCAPSSCPAQYDHGKRYAQYLNQGLTILSAWGNAIADGDGQKFSPSVMFSGNSSSDCTSRRSGMTWDNFDTYPRRRNSSVSVICGWRWDDLD